MKNLGRLVGALGVVMTMACQPASAQPSGDVEILNWLGGADAAVINQLAEGFQAKYPDLKIKQVAVSENSEGPFIKGTPAEIQANQYPYGRYLYFYARREANGKIDPVAVDYLKLLLSKEGQQIFAAQANGYIPLSAADAAAERAKLDQ